MLFSGCVPPADTLSISYPWFCPSTPETDTAAAATATWNSGASTDSVVLWRRALRSAAWGSERGGVLPVLLVVPIVSRMRLARSYDQTRKDLRAKERDEQNKIALMTQMKLSITKPCQSTLCSSSQRSPFGTWHTKRQSPSLRSRRATHEAAGGAPRALRYGTRLRQCTQENAMQRSLNARSC